MQSEGFRLCCLAGFKQLRLKDLNLAYCHTLAASEGTFAILSEIPTLTTLSLQGCNITQSLPNSKCSACSLNATLCPALQSE